MGHYHDATVFQLLAFLATAQRELQAAEQLVREAVQVTDPPGDAAPPSR